VIVAVIDTGIDVFHESFVNPDGTSRILELWDPDRRAGRRLEPPAGFIQIGKVYSKQQLTAAIAVARRSRARTPTGTAPTWPARRQAAGGRQDDRCSFPGHYIGVAPEADLVIRQAIGVTTATSSRP